MLEQHAIQLGGMVYLYAIHTLTDALEISVGYASPKGQHYFDVKKTKRLGSLVCFYSA